jgi:tetratricopeptide (TPR) repeat protein
LAFYQEYLDQRDSSGMMREVSAHYSAGTLERLVRHPQREVRRAAVFALGVLGDYGANHALGCALHDEDRIVRTLADEGIRRVWMRAGSETECWELNILVRLNAAEQFLEAVRRATRLIETAPWLAEAWSQRALAESALARYGDAIRDCHEVLELNPYHFIAAATMGQAYLELNNPISALESFRRALRLNPDLEGVRAQIVRLAKRVEGT